MRGLSTILFKAGRDKQVRRSRWVSFCGLAGVLVAGLPDLGEAQGFRRGEQFATLSFGGGAVGYDLIQARYTNRGAHVMVPVQVRVSTNSAAGVRSNTLAVLSGIVIGW